MSGHGSSISVAGPGLTNAQPGMPHDDPLGRRKVHIGSAGLNVKSLILFMNYMELEMKSTRLASTVNDSSEVFVPAVLEILLRIWGRLG
jgi:hypothetical protein